MDSLVSHFEAFKGSFNKNDLPAAHKQLTQLKLEMTKFGFLVPDASDARRFLLSREILEHAVLLSIKEKDTESFERNFSQLKTYYSDVPKSAQIPESERKWLIVGLNLLRLLVSNRIAEFHTELENIPFKVQQENVYVRHSIQLETHLMEGSYNKIYESRNTVPAESYAHFTELLMDTIRSEIAASIEKAYPSLRVIDAQKLLRLPNVNVTLAFALQRKWEVHDDLLRFPAAAALESKSGASAASANKKAAAPSMEIIHQALNYAKELERIV